MEPCHKSILFTLHKGMGISPSLTTGHLHVSDLTGCHKALLLQYDFNIHNILLGTPIGYAESHREIGAPLTADVQNYRTKLERRGISMYDL
jgi:hypothetical protein